LTTHGKRRRIIHHRHRRMFNYFSPSVLLTLQRSGALELYNVHSQAQSEYKHSLSFRVRRNVVIATKLVHWLQMHPTVHN